MNKLIQGLLIALLMLLMGPAHCNAAGSTQGAELFQQHCAACHRNGGNIIRRGKTLKLKALERENRERQDLSPWEQGMRYRRALGLGLFTSNRALATALGIDHSNVGKSLALARLRECAAHCENGLALEPDNTDIKAIIFLKFNF